MPKESRAELGHCVVHQNTWHQKSFSARYGNMATDLIHLKKKIFGVIYSPSCLSKYVRKQFIFRMQIFQSLFSQNSDSSKHSWREWMGKNLSDFITNISICILKKAVKQADDEWNTMFLFWTYLLNESPISFSLLGLQQGCWLVGTGCSDLWNGCWISAFLRWSAYTDLWENRIWQGQNMSKFPINKNTIVKNTIY